jgi:hypothetical protein
LALAPQAAFVRAQTSDGPSVQSKGGDSETILRDGFKNVMAALQTDVLRHLQKPPSPAGPGVPSDFGASGGTPISNKATVMSQIDQAVGTGKPPAFELIYCDMGPNTDFGFTLNPAGHMAARYTMPDGTQKVFNVSGTSLVSPLLIAFSKPEDYFFGTNFAATNGGVYDRSYYSIRIESLPPEQLAKLDAFYTGLAARGQDGTALFDMLSPQIQDAIHRNADYGNCATWSSVGLHEASGLLSDVSMYPKEDWARLYKEMKAKDPNNVHVVAYHSASSAVHVGGMNDRRNGPAAIWDPVMSVKYWNLEKLVDVAVDVPPASMEAVVSHR